MTQPLFFNRSDPMRHPSMVSRPALSKVQRPTGRDLHQLVCFRPRHMSQVRGLINRVFIWFFLFTKTINTVTNMLSESDATHIPISELQGGPGNNSPNFSKFRVPHTHTLFGHSGRLGIGWMVEQLWGLFYPLPFPSCTHARLVHFRHLLSSHRTTMSIRIRLLTLPFWVGDS